MTEIIGKKEDHKGCIQAYEQIGHLIMMVHMRGLCVWGRPREIEDRKYSMFVYPSVIIIIIIMNNAVQQQQ
jgi:hypothetical protein